MRVVIVAGDPFAPAKDEADVFEHLEALNREHAIGEVVCAERPGIEEYASKWCEGRNLNNRVYSHGDNTKIHVARPLSYILMHDYALRMRSEGHEVLGMVFGERGGVLDLVRKLRRDGFSVRTLRRVPE